MAVCRSGVLQAGDCRRVGAGLGLVGVGMVGVGVGQGGGPQCHNLAGVNAVGSCWVGSQYQLSWIVLCWVWFWYYKDRDLLSPFSV